MFVGEVAVDLEVLADALDHIEVNVVQGGAAGGQASVMARISDGASVTPGGDGSCWAGDEVLGGLLIAQANLYPFVAF